METPVVESSSPPPPSSPLPPPAVAPPVPPPPPSQIDLASLKQQQAVRNKEKKIHIGHINNKPPADGTFTTNFTETEMRDWVQKINTRAQQNKPFPLHVNHITKNPRGEPIRPAGEILWAEIDEETGRTRAACILYDNDPLAEYVKKLMGEVDGIAEEDRWYEFSMGWGFEPVVEDGLTELKDKQLIEVSLCAKGDKEGTRVEKSPSVSFVAANGLRVPERLKPDAHVERKFTYASPHYDAEKMRGKRDLDLECTVDAVENVNSSRKQSAEGYINSLLKNQNRAAGGLDQVTLVQAKYGVVPNPNHHSHLQPRDNSTGRFVTATASAFVVDMDRYNGMTSVGARSGGQVVALGSRNFSYANVKKGMQSANRVAFFPTEKAFNDGCMQVLNNLDYSSATVPAVRPGYNGRTIRAQASASSDMMEVDGNVSSAPVASSSPSVPATPSIDNLQHLQDLAKNYVSEDPKTIEFNKRVADAISKIKSVSGESGVAPERFNSNLTKYKHDPAALATDLSDLKIPNFTPEQLESASPEVRDALMLLKSEKEAEANRRLMERERKSDQERLELQQYIDEHLPAWNAALVKEGKAPIDAQMLLQNLAYSTDTSEKPAQTLKNIVIAAASRHNEMQSEMKGRASVLEELFQQNREKEILIKKMQGELADANKRIKSSSGAIFDNPEDKYRQDAVVPREETERKMAPERAGVQHVTMGRITSQAAADILDKMPRRAKIYAKAYVEGHTLTKEQIEDGATKYAITPEHLLRQTEIFTNEADQYFLKLDGPDMKAKVVYGGFVRDRSKKDLTPLFDFNRSKEEARLETVQGFSQLQSLPGAGLLPPQGSRFFGPVY